MYNIMESGVNLIKNMIEWSNLIFDYSTWVYFRNYPYIENKNNLCEK